MVSQKSNLVFSNGFLDYKAALIVSVCSGLHYYIITEGLLHLIKFPQGALECSL